MQLAERKSQDSGLACSDSDRINESTSESSLSYQYSNYCGIVQPQANLGSSKMARKSVELPRIFVLTPRVEFGGDELDLAAANGLRAPDPEKCCVTRDVL